MLEPKKPGETGDGTSGLQSGTQQKTLKEGQQEGSTPESTDTKQQQK